MSRIFLVLLTNLGVMVMLTLTLSFFGLDRVLNANGLEFKALLIYASVIGFGGAFISLLISKPLAKAATGAKVIHAQDGEVQAWLVNTVHTLSQRAGIKTPEVALYHGEPNAFATGPTRNNALVAVSDGLLNSLRQEQVEAVLAHEVAHIAGQDMVTLTLVQGVANTFTVFVSRLVGYLVDRVLLKNQNGHGMAYYMTVVISEVFLGLLAGILVRYVSRTREYRADAGAAALMGSAAPMISALHALEGLSTGGLPKELAAFGVTGTKGWMKALFATHPSISSRVKALRALG
jgi:heat shock protein HtpX